MRVYLVDGTYELFRQYYGSPSHVTARGEVGAVRGALRSTVRLLEDGATHLGVATDHVIESFRNRLYEGYKTGAAIDEAIASQFGVFEEALDALGVRVWPMVEEEADDALASASRRALDDARVEQVVILSADKDLAQCVVGDRVILRDRRSGRDTDADGVVARFGVEPDSIPDWLALVGDAADGYPGIRGWGRVGAAHVLREFGHLDAIPIDTGRWPPELRRRVRGADRLAARLGEEIAAARLYLRLATLRDDLAVYEDVDELRWAGPRDELAGLCAALDLDDVCARVARRAESDGHAE